MSLSLNTYLSRIKYLHYFFFPFSHEHNRVGPFISGAIFTVTGDYRRAFWFPLALTVVGTGLLGMINMDRGKDQAQKFAHERDAASPQEH